MRNDKVFVSPGVYTSERDLTFVTNNVGVTTLGLAGETLKGPAFQPIFITNYGQMSTFFGGLDPKKNKQNGALQYELPYIAKSYLQNSNQLYITRVLGLSGYDAGEIYVLELDGIQVATLRSRAFYDGDTLTFKAETVALAAGATYEEITLTVNDVDFKVSLDKTKSNYITRVLGRKQDDGKTPLFVEEIYPKLIEENQIGSNPVTLNITTAGFENYNTKYRSAFTPYIVSEVKGGDVTRLFRLETISDGNSANKDVKVSITNIKPDDKTFDLEVRKIYDRDSSPSIVERYSKVSMDPTSNDFIAKRVGTSNGDFPAISSYILVELNEEEDTKESFPAGFEGYTVRDGISTPEVAYNEAYTEFENKRRKYLGLPDDMDVDLFSFKGADDFQTKTKGFHLDSEADITKFVVGETSIKNESELIGTSYDKPYSRKFTVAFAGGFDGWDIYRKERTYGDEYTVQRAPDGMFDSIALSNEDEGNTSDFYAFYEAYRTFSNPESVNVNVFATPGIDLFNNPILSQYIIDMIERERGDSIYIATTPDMSEGSKRTPQDVSYDLAEQFDSNYTATYWPWIQKNDSENNVNVFLSPTCEVVKNIALTDNVAHPWFATAGYKFGRVDAIQTRLNVTQVDREVLYGNRINPITTFAGVGIAIMGNKNLQIAKTALDRINVRRLLLQARKLVSAVGMKLLFEPNDESVRDEFIRQVNPILENMRKERGLKKFKIEIDPLSPEGRDRNTMSGRIRIQPTSALEYISISFDVTQNGASFEDV